MEADCAPPTSPDEKLIAMLADAHRWLDALTEGRAASLRELARRTRRDVGEISRTLPLAFLAPTIVESILDGRQPVGLTPRALRRIGTMPFRLGRPVPATGLSATLDLSARSNPDCSTIYTAIYRSKVLRRHARAPKPHYRRRLSLGADLADRGVEGRTSTHKQPWQLLGCTAALRPCTNPLRGRDVWGRRRGQA